MVTNIEVVSVEAASPAEPQATSGVSWAAVLAGAAVASAVSLIMLALGAGLGLATVSPWPGLGASAVAVTAGAAIWLVVTQWVSAGFGGYVTGRMRTRWKTLHTHEVFYRDTAHGLITWSLGAVVLATMIALAGATALKAAGASSEAPYAYEIDSLFRPATPATTVAPQPAPAGEVTRLLQHDLPRGDMPDQDRAYLRDLVIAHTGLTAEQASQRVDAFVAASRAVADKARKAAASAAMFMALSMLVGAFIACVAAALGGQQRDEHP